MAPKPELLSMTGFGRGRAVHGSLSIEVELRSVNHRFFELSCKLPRGYQELEADLRARVAEWVDRGRVELSVQRQAESSTGAVYSEKSFKQYWAVYRKLLGEKALREPAVKARVVSDILSKKEVLGAPEDQVQCAREQKPLFKALDAALLAHHKMRAFEGAKLGRDISQRAATLSNIVSQMKGNVSHDPQAVRERLVARVKKLAPEVLADEARLASEVVYLVDRGDITEEFVRLESHFAQLSQILKGTAQGRKLEFLLQELGREFNTIGSKAQNTAIQHGVVQAKVELEKIREQLQNIS